MFELDVVEVFVQGQDGIVALLPSKLKYFKIVGIGKTKVTGMRGIWKGLSYTS